MNEARARFVVVILPCLGLAAVTAFACSTDGEPCSSSAECSNGTCTPGGRTGARGVAPTIECSTDSDCNRTTTTADAAAASDAGDAEAGEGGASSPIPAARVCIRAGEDRVCGPPPPPCDPQQCGANGTCAGTECKPKSCSADSDCAGFCVNGKCSEIAGRCLSNDAPLPP